MMPVHNKPYWDGYQMGSRLEQAIAINLEVFWSAVADLGLSMSELVAFTHEDECRLPRHLREEIRGMADGGGQNYRHLLAYNLYRSGIACDC